MKKIFKFLSLLLIFTFVIGSSFAQTVNISGQIRPRYEYRHGYKTLTPDGFKAANFISQRTRLNAFYGNKYFKFGLVLQNVRVWGDVPQLNSSDINGTAIHEAWGEILFSNKFAVKVGRQEISYDDQRIFGSVNWAQQARSHDAFIFKIKPSNTSKLDIGFAYNSSKASLFNIDYNVNNYKTFQYIWYHSKFKHLGLSLLFLNNGMAYNNIGNGQEVVYSQTLGGRVTYKKESLKLNSAFYYQGGKNKFNRSLSAIYYTANISYSLSSSFSLGIGTEYLSGTSSKNQTPTFTDHSFKPLYGTNHKFNGWMDYFYVGSYMYNNGLVDFNLPLIYKVNKTIFKLIPHYYAAAAKVSVKQSNGTWKDYNNNLGAEIDFSVGYHFSKTVIISGGYSQMFATKTMQALKGGNYQNTNNWAWLMLTFKPTFFSKK